MVWGCFHANGVGILRKIEGTMDQNQYHTILCHAVIPEIKKLTNEEPNDVIWIFQHDNDPKHTAKKNERYLETKQGEGQLKFHVMPWPSQSPDLNPIENLWNIIKDALDDRIDRPSNLDDLFQFVKEEWEKVPKDYLRNLVDNLPRRIQDVIKNKGGSTRY
jgi:transposase